MNVCKCTERKTFNTTRGFYEGKPRQYTKNNWFATKMAQYRILKHIYSIFLPNFKFWYLKTRRFPTIF